MADERLRPSRRSRLMLVTRPATVVPRSVAIAFSASQNSSSRLTPVLRPATTIVRCLTNDLVRGDFIGLPPRRALQHADGLALVSKREPPRRSVIALKGAQ